MRWLAVAALLIAAVAAIGCGAVGERGPGA